MKVKINNIDEILNLNFENMHDDSYWNNSNIKENSMHKIHIYPAKFPALIAQKFIEYSKINNHKLETIGDIFCGCGTVGLESKLNGIDFWGTDINPVASLISYAKTVKANPNTTERYFRKISKDYKTQKYKCEKYDKRLLYWFDLHTYDQLYNLRESIINSTPNGKYRKIFNMLFSSILKSSSRWLTSSIKPQIDPMKHPQEVFELFRDKKDKFISAILVINEKDIRDSKICIENKDILKIKRIEFLDAIITSPPYVTSYEYADLHQLSSLWLGFTNDYTKLRENSIGSMYHLVKKNYCSQLSKIALSVVNGLNFDNHKKMLVERYYSDMEKVVQKCWKILKPDGIILFVIGNTEFKNVKIKNAEALCEMLINNDFTIIEIAKRKISGKFLPSHRDSNGKFTSSVENSKKIYSQEYIIIGEKRK